MMMSLGDPFRLARGARGVEELGHRVLVHGVKIGAERGARGEQRLVVVGPRRPLGRLANHVVPDPWRRGAQLLDQGQELGVEDQDARLGVREDVRDLGRRQPDVDRVQHGAGLQDAVVALEQLVRVERQERDDLAPPDADAFERRRQPVHPLVVLGVAEAAVAVHDADLAAVEPGRAQAELEGGQGDVHRFAIEVRRPPRPRRGRRWDLAGGRRPTPRPRAR